MTYLNQLSYHKPLIDLIDDHILKCFTWNMLDEDDVELMTAECITCLGPDASDCILQSDDLDVIMHELGKHLKTARNGYDLTQAITKAATTYFCSHLQELFEERSEILDYDRHIDAGMIPHIDQQTGECEWRSKTL